MAAWNLALRFGLELVALVGLILAASQVASGPIQLATVVIVPLVAAILWGVLNVTDDPSRSGAAPIVVPGWVRLALELGILLAGCAGLVLSGLHSIGIAFAIALAIHYLASWQRVQWLLEV